MSEAKQLFMEVSLAAQKQSFDAMEALNTFRGPQGEPGNLTDEMVKNAIDSYFEKNPVETGATPEQVKQIEANTDGVASNKQAIENLTAEDVGALPSDGTAADANKLNGKEAKYYIQPIELLDNPEFAIAQAGYMGQHGSKYYAADRWMSESANVSVTRSGDVTTIQNNGSSSAVILQKASSDKHALYAGKPITLAICLNDDTILCKSDVMPSAPESSSVHACWLDLPNGTLMVNIFAASINSYQFARFVIHSGASVSFKWIRLIPGTYTADNLPPYVPKGYAAELAECKRYFRAFSEYRVSTVGSALIFEIEHEGMHEIPDVIITHPSTGELNKVSNYVSAGSVDVSIQGKGKDRTIIKVSGTDGNTYFYRLQIDGEL